MLQGYSPKLEERDWQFRVCMTARALLLETLFLDTSAFGILKSQRIQVDFAFIGNRTSHRFGWFHSFGVTSMHASPYSTYK